MKKRLLCVLLVTVMLVGLLPGITIANAATSGITGDCTWSLDGTVLTISGNGAMGNYGNTGPWGYSITEVVIEDGVTSIGDYAFYDCELLESITIGSGLTSIGDYAFTYCSSLMSIIIGDDVTSIGDKAFYCCTSITSIDIPDSVTLIGGAAFAYCLSLKSITFGDGVTSIGKDAFCECPNLRSVNVTDLAAWCNVDFATSTSNPLSCGNLYHNGVLLKEVTIPNGVTEIKKYAFYECSSITSVDIPDSVTLIGDEAFLFCPSLESVSIGNGVTSIGEEAFYYCPSLASVDFGDSLTTIGDKAFYYCTSITSVDIPDSVTLIGDYAFNYCSSLESITIGGGVSSIGEEAFDCCFDLKIVDVTDLAAWCNIDFATFQSNPLYYGSNLYHNGVLLKKVTIPNGVTEIKKYAFYECTSITSVDIPDSVTLIGDYAFYECELLESITIGGGVTSIGEYAFCGCFDLKSVDVTDLAAWCNIDFAMYMSNPFYYFGNLYHNGVLLEEVTIPNGVTEIKKYAFYSCDSIRSVDIPDSVTSIGNEAFYCCHSLMSVDIPDSVTSIGEFAFYNTGLRSVDIPDGMTSIGDYAFYCCTKLLSLTIPDSIVSIGDYAFYGCSWAESVIIPDSVTSIGDYAFYDCSSITDVYYKGSKQQWDAISIGENNDLLINATMYYNFCDEHTYDNYCDTECNVCGVTRETTEHKYDNTCDIDCNECGATRATEHNYDINGCDTDCNVCGATREVEHDYDSVCSNTCNICGATRATEHKYDNDCDTTCNVCGATRYVDHDYDNVCDNTCNLCGATITITHAYSEYVSDDNATTEKDGTKTRACFICGAKDTVIDEGSKLPTVTPTPTPTPDPKPEPTPDPKPSVEIKDTSKIFKDIPAKKWFKEYVDYSVAYGIFTGTSKTEFSPNSNITRAQFVQVLANLQGVDTSNRNVTTQFKDVPAKKWFTAAVKWASENKIVNGVGDGKFDPNANVTREQMCVMLVNYAKFKNITLKTVENKENFVDDGKISKWAKTAVYKCQQADIVNGKGEGEFDPQGTGTRAEASVIFTKFHKNYMIK